MKYEAVVIVDTWSIVLVGEFNTLMSAGTVRHYERVLRQDMSASQVRKFIRARSKVQSITFERGLEEEQAEVVDDCLRVNAAGLVKLWRLYDGKLSKVLKGTSLSNAQRFMDNVAARLMAGQPVEGATARYTASQLDARRDFLTLIGCMTPAQYLAGPSEEEWSRAFDKFFDRLCYRPPA